MTDLYGAALERMTDLAVAAKPELAQAFADDDLVASLLLVHGLHPHGVERRVADALDGVRPYLGSHGGDVALLEVTDGVVRLQLLGSCKSCPSSSVTLELAVEDAVRAAAPEIDVDRGGRGRAGPGIDDDPGELADEPGTRHRRAGPWHPGAATGRAGRR